MTLTFGSRPGRSATRQMLARAAALAAAPAFAVFLSSNLVNAGNLAFNVVFSRWMGPDLFGQLAFVLTVKLSLLAFLGALQMAVSERVAATPAAAMPGLLRALSGLQTGLFAVLWLALPILALALTAAPGQAHGTPALLLIFLLSLPFAAPLALLRGVAFGAGMTGRTIASANVEMAVRLVGGALVWWAGGGIEGVVFAIALSIIAGWACLFGTLPMFDRARAVPVAPLTQALGLAALPYAALQLAQILALDGDILLAGLLLVEGDAGYLGALALFQRIQFFACVALASVLLPQAVRAARDGRPLLPEVGPVAGLVLAVAGLSLTAALLAPAALVSALVGERFLPAAPALLPAMATAVAFTVTYLLSTFLSALGNRRGIRAALAVAIGQIALTGVIAGRPDAAFSDLVLAKAACQTALALGLAAYTWAVLRGASTGHRSHGRPRQMG